MTFHNLQSSLIYRLKTQEIALQRLCISKFSRGASPGSPSAFSRRQRRSSPLSLTARYGPVALRVVPLSGTVFLSLVFSRAPLLSSIEWSAPPVWKTWRRHWLIMIVDEQFIYLHYCSSAHLHVSSVPPEIYKFLYGSKSARHLVN